MRCYIFSGLVTIVWDNGLIEGRPDFEVGEESRKTLAFARFVVEHGLMCHVAYTFNFLIALPKDLEGVIMWPLCPPDGDGMYLTCDW